MDNLLFLTLLVLIATPLRAEIFDEDSDEEYELPEMLTQQHGNKILANVDGFGAAGDGVSDDTQAFVSAWKLACSAPNPVFLVPEGRRYLVNATRFQGPCADSIVLQIEGTIVAPDDPESWDPRSQRTWLSFHNVTMALFQGNGVIDGSGSKWWSTSCKRNKTNPCREAPTAFTIESSSFVKVSGLTIQNSQQMNFAVSHSQSIRVTNVKVSSPGDSPNTDGIHITGSTNVLLQNCKIQTGDDCISIVSGSSSIRMKNIHCGPGHGISIGSLGKNNSSGMVEKVFLDTAFIRSTTNGLRIKTWQGGIGYVRSVRFQRVTMNNVSNPIIIDQFYCDSRIPCQNQTSAVEISKIMYQDIIGISRSKEAIRFACSDTVPCSQILLKNINIQNEDGGTVETFCNSASGTQVGNVQPSAGCLASSGSNMMTLQETEICSIQSNRQFSINRSTTSEPPDDLKM